MNEISYREFCELNNLVCDGSMHVITEALFPKGEFCADFTFVLYTTGGTSSISIDGRKYDIKRRCISVWRPGQKIEFCPDDSLQYRLMLISGDLSQFISLSGVFLTLSVTDEFPVIRITNSYNEVIRLYFETITNVTNLLDNPFKKDCLISVIKGLFYSTGIYVLRALRIKDGELYSFVGQYPEFENSTASRFIKLVEQHSTKKRHLSYYADLMDYNPKYLSALIKRETGHSGQTLIDQYSVLAAMAKLSYGHQSIKEISDEMEFQSQSDFGKFFKRMTGVSPLTYRKKRFSREN